MLNWNSKTYARRHTLLFHPIEWKDNELLSYSYSFIDYKACKSQSSEYIIVNVVMDDLGGIKKQIDWTNERHIWLNFFL